MSDFFLLHLTDKTNAKLTTIFVILNSSLRNDVYGKSTVYYSRLTVKIQNLPLTVPSYVCFVTTALPGCGKRNPPMFGKHLLRFLLILLSSS